MTIGRKERLPQDCSAFSNAGMRRDQIEAESMMPAARPIVIILTIFEVLLKKKINKAPSVVIRNGSVNPNTIVAVSFISFVKTPILYQFMEKKIKK